LSPSTSPRATDSVLRRAGFRSWPESVKAPALDRGTAFPKRATLSMGSSESISRRVLRFPIVRGAKVISTVQLPPAVIIGVALTQGLTPPLTFSVKLLVSKRDIFDTLRLAVPGLEMVTSKGRELDLPGYPASPGDHCSYHRRIR
jgi:hypothetical protein